MKTRQIKRASFPLCLRQVDPIVAKLERPLGGFKHQEVIRFVQKHGISWPWLLEGKGRIFKKDPIRLSPNMSGNELAAVVATIPEADQQAIRAKAREILQERDQ